MPGSPEGKAEISNHQFIGGQPVPAALATDSRPPVSVSNSRNYDQKTLLVRSPTRGRSLMRFYCPRITLITRLPACPPRCSGRRAGRQEFLIFRKRKIYRFTKLFPACLNSVRTGIRINVRFKETKRSNAPTRNKTGRNAVEAC